MVRRHALIVLALGMALVAALVGATAGTAARGATTVSIDYATSFGNFGRDSYVYVAIEKGYFEQAGLDVRVIPGTGSVDNIKLVAAGRLDYSPVDIGALMVTRANEGLPVRTVAVIHQNTMSAVFTLQEENVTTPKGLEGKTLADSPASTVRVLFPLYAKKAGIDASKITWRDAAPPALPALLAAKQVDGIGQFSVGVPLVSRAAGGKAIRSFKYSKVLPGLLGIGVVASDEKLRSNPGEVRRFTRALLRGLRYALDNPGEAGYILKKHQPLADPIVAAQELRIMKFFAQNKLTRQKANGLGYIDVQKFNATASVIRNGFKLTGRLNAADTWSPVAVNVRRAAL